MQQIFSINQATNKITGFIRTISQSLTISNLANKLSNFNRNLINILNINSLTFKTSSFFKSVFESFNINTITERTVGFIRNVINSLTYLINVIRSFTAGILPSGGGGGGGTGINPKIINSTLCNYTYEYINEHGIEYSLIDLEIDKIREETNITFNWVEVREYLDNWQFYCSDNINRSLKEDLVCSKAKEFRETNYTKEEILNTTKELRGEIIISTNLLTHYIENYNSLCGIKPFSIIPLEKVKENYFIFILISILLILLILALGNKKRILLILMAKRKREKNLIRGET